MSFRTYREVTGADRSDLGGQVAELRARVARRLRDTRRVLAVLSGKGGVGKSFVSAFLAIGAARGNRAVGVLDADLASPTVASLLRAKGPLRLHEDGSALLPARGTADIRVVSSDLILADQAPLTWRGPTSEQFLWRGALEHGMLREFLSDVAWGSLDLLAVDLPPGSDAAVDLATLVPNVAGGVVVTLPTEESRRSVTRAVRAGLEAGIPMLGIVENMSGYTCPGCQATHPLFPGRAGDALSEEFGIPLLGRVPLASHQAPDEVAEVHRHLVDRVLEAIG